MLKNRLIIAGLVICLILAAVPAVLSAASSQSSGVALDSGGQQSTAPTNTLGKVSTTAVTSNIATKYWLELKAYPSSSTRSLWLYAGNDWRYLSNPSENIENSVQNAFANPDIFQVKVWYSGSKIVGLTVMTK